MDPVSAGIMVGGNLLGGIFGKSNPQKENWRGSRGALMGQAEGARWASDAYGFNPLTLLGVSQPVSGGGNGNATMGAAIADSMMILADSLAKKTDTSSGAAQQVTRLANQNATLKRKLDSQTIRPKVGGIYAQNEAVPSLASALGKSNGQADSVLHGQSGSRSGPAGAGDGLRPLQTTEPVDPRRKADNMPVSTHSGFMVIDNPYLDGPIRIPTMDGDEPLQWYDYPTLGLNWLGNRLYDSQVAKVGPARDDRPYIERESLKSKRPKPKPPRPSKTMKPLARPSDFY